MEHREQSALEFITTYGILILAVVVVIGVVFTLSSTSSTVVPNSCSFYGSFTCVDVAYAANSQTGGSTFLMSAGLSVPGMVNVSSFNAVYQGVNGIDEYCSTTGAPNGPTSISQGERLICMASFPVKASDTQEYSGTFTIKANYCPTTSSGAACQRGSGYVFEGSWKTQGTYNVSFSTSIPITMTTVTTSTSTSTTTSTSTSSSSTTSTGGSSGGSSVTTSAVYAYIQGGPNTDYMSVINTETNTVANVYVGPNVGYENDASCVSVLPNQEQAYLLYAYEGEYVYNSVSATMSEIQGIGATPSDNEITATPPVAPNGAYVYVPGKYLGGGSNFVVYTISTATDSVTNTLIVNFQGSGTAFPYRMITSPDGNLLYVSVVDVYNQKLGAIYTINSVTDTVVNSITESGWPLDLAVSNDGSTLYAIIGNAGIASGSKVQVINTGTHVIANTITISGASSLGVLQISEDGSWLYALGENDGIFAKINTGTDTYTKASPSSLPTSSGLDAIGLTDDGTRAYIPAAAYGYNEVFVVNTVPATPVVSPNPISVGSQPTGVAITPDGSSVYVTNSGGSTVSVISTATNQVTNTLTVISNPTFVAIAGGRYSVEPT